MDTFMDRLWTVMDMSVQECHEIPWWSACEIHKFGSNIIHQVANTYNLVGLVGLFVGLSMALWDFPRTFPQGKPDYILLQTVCSIIFLDYN